MTPNTYYYNVIDSNEPMQRNQINAILSDQKLVSCRGQISLTHQKQHYISAKMQNPTLRTIILKEYQCLKNYYHHRLIHGIHFCIKVTPLPGEANKIWFFKRDQIHRVINLIKNNLRFQPSTFSNTFFSGYFNNSYQSSR